MSFKQISDLSVIVEFPMINVFFYCIDNSIQCTQAWPRERQRRRVNTSPNIIKPLFGSSFPKVGCVRKTINPWCQLSQTISNNTARCRHCPIERSRDAEQGVRAPLHRDHSKNCVFGVLTICLASFGHFGKHSNSRNFMDKTQT